MTSDTLVTRKQCRALGLNYSNTQFQRWEKAKLLTAIKPGNFPSARVHYRWGQVEAFLAPRVKKLP
jgi:hypothetical protein